MVVSDIVVKSLIAYSYVINSATVLMRIWRFSGRDLQGRFHLTLWEPHVLYRSLKSRVSSGSKTRESFHYH